MRRTWRSSKIILKKVMRLILSMPARLAAGLLKAYHRWASPWLPRSCRFYPTCSVYAAEVITTFGLFKGGFLSLIRISKCHPFHPGGVDMPPLPVQGEKNKR